MKMYQALSGAAAQKAVLRALARDRLSKALQDELELILSAVKKAAGKRNNIVHGHWYLSENHPDELVWAAASEELLGYSEFWSGYNRHPEQEKKIRFALDFRGKPAARLLYNKKDFEEVLAEITLVGSKLANFNIAVEKLHRFAGKQASVGGK